MPRDTYDMFNRSERGRFGDAEVRGNESVRSDLVDFTFLLRDEKPLALAVSQTEGSQAKWIWLPKSKIEFVLKGKGLVEVTMPQWLAREKGLI
jgi:hypothetical protein